MASYAIVSTKSQLEQALKDNVDKIIVTNPDLAQNIKVVKFATKATLTTAIAGAAVAATNFWNPIGWGAGAVGIVAGGSSMAAIIALGLGATLIFLIYNSYDIKAKGKVKMPDGTEVEGEIILEKR